MDRRGRDAESSRGNGRDHGHRDLNRDRDFNRSRQDDRQVERGRAWDRRYDDLRDNDRHGRGGDRDRGRDRHDDGRPDYDRRDRDDRDGRSVDRRVRPPVERDYDRGYDGRNRRRYDDDDEPAPREPEPQAEHPAEAPSSPNRSAADMVKAIVEQAKIRAIVELQAMDRLEAERWASLSMVQPTCAARQPEDPPVGQWVAAPMPVPTSPWMMAQGAPWPLGAMPPISTCTAAGGTSAGGATTGGASFGSASVAAAVAFPFVAPPHPVSAAAPDLLLLLTPP